MAESSDTSYVTEPLRFTRHWSGRVEVATQPGRYFASRLVPPGHFLYLRLRVAAWQVRRASRRQWVNEKRREWAADQLRRFPER